MVELVRYEKRGLSITMTFRRYGILLLFLITFMMFATAFYVLAWDSPGCWEVSRKVRSLFGKKGRP